MAKLKIVLSLALLALAIAVGWQVASYELANVELREELRDIASEGAAHIGLAAPSTDEDLRRAVIHAAKGHGIELEPGQVTVKRSGAEEAPTFYLAADYNRRLRLPLGSFTLHFNPSSAR
jgi:hypothetical protein